MVAFIRNVQFLFFEYLEVKAQKISFFSSLMCIFWVESDL